MRGIYANTNPKKFVGKTAIMWDDDLATDLYGGGRKGAKRWGYLMNKGVILLEVKLLSQEEEWGGILDR